MQEGALVQVLPAWAPRAGVIHALFPSRRGMVPAVRRLLDFLGERVTTEALTVPCAAPATASRSGSSA
jgi:DNA-binding transcriptional LysR family regulator